VYFGGVCTFFAGGGTRIYHNPEDFPPGGFLTRIQALGPSLSSSSAKQKIK
jgi:hypothetical protein